MIITILLSIGVGLAVNEACDLSPWLARKIARWSAFRRYPDPARAKARAEELAAVINDRPGKLFKLITACGFATAASLTSSRRRRLIRLLRLVAGGAGILIGSSGVISGIVFAADHNLTITQAIGQTGMASTWITTGVVLAHGKLTSDASPLSQLTLVLSVLLGCTANVAFYLYGGDAAHLAWSAVWLCILLAAAAGKLITLHDERRYQELRAEHDALYPDCAECLLSASARLEQRFSAS